MSSEIQVELYEGSKAIRPDILAFLDSLEFVPVQHDPRWAKVYEKLENEHFFFAVAKQKDTILGVSPFTVFNGPFGAILHANPYMGYGGCSVAAGRESVVIGCLMEAIINHARESGCVTASVATPPFSETLVDLYISALKPDYCHKKFYQYHYLNQHPFEGLTRKRRGAFASEVRRHKVQESKSHRRPVYLRPGLTSTRRVISKSAQGFCQGRFTKRWWRHLCRQEKPNCILRTRRADC